MVILTARQISVAQRPSLLPGVMAFVQEDGGSFGLSRVIITTLPGWTLDGQYPAFDVAVSADLLTVQRSDIFAIKADGSGLTQSTTDGRSFHPAWVHWAVVFIEVP